MKKLKIRLLPTVEQEEKMWKHINHTRNVKNIFLAKCFEMKNNGVYINKSTSNTLRLELTEMLKTDNYSYLKEVSRDTLDRAVNSVVQSYVDWCKGTHGKPKFKKKSRSTKYFDVRENRLKRYDNTFYIPSVGKVKMSMNTFKTNLSTIKCIEKVDKFRKTSIKYDGKYWIMFITYNEKLVTPQKPRELTNETIGIDLGIKTLVTCSNGKSYKNVNKSSKVKKLEKKLNRLQRQVSRKYEMNKQGKKFIKTNNIIKLEQEIRLLHRKLSNIRNNHIHTMTKEIVEQLPQEIVIEDLKVNNLRKNKHLSKHISKANWYTIRKYLEYKCEDRGILLTIANQYYPSSQTCSNCGNRLTKQDKLSLNDRTYKCFCGNNLDRDYNASINLKNYRYSKWYQDNIISQ